MVPRAPEKEILVSETINGSLSVSNDVIADIAGYAAMTCYGVVGMAEQQLLRGHRAGGEHRERVALGVPVAQGGSDIRIQGRGEVAIGVK